MKLICDGSEFAARISRYTGALPSKWGDGEINVFVAEGAIRFPKEAKWEIESEGQRVELAIRPEKPVGHTENQGVHIALFTSPAVG